MEIIQPNNQDQSKVPTVQVPKKTKKKFFCLLLIQVIIVLASTIFIDNLWYYTKPYQYNSRIMTEFRTYCEFTPECKTNPDFNHYRAYAEWKDNAPILTTCNYQDLFLLAFTCYPFLIFIQTILKYFSLPLIIQMLIYVIQIPPMILYTQAIFSDDGLSQRMNEIAQFAQMSLVFLILNLIFLLLNGYFFQFNTEYNNLKYPVFYFYLILCFIFGIGYQLDLFQSNFAFQILFFMHLQLYLLKLDTYLFEENNKFSKQNKHLWEVIFAKLFKKVENTSYLKKNKVSIIIIIFGIIYILEQQNFILLILIIFLLIGMFFTLTWDVSLLSTQTKLREKDSYLAANLFFLDACFPFQSLLLEYLVDD